jgi:ferredoxin-thioredoxin reductase catalytic subunit/rubredoxin
MENMDKKEIEEFYTRLKTDTESGGYNLNPDIGFTMDLIRGLLVNQERYGYPVCPCRLAAGQKADDLDIICPCDYRDPDLDEYGVCYCALYVDREIIKGKKEIKSIPERRYMEQDEGGEEILKTDFNIKYPVWRCRVCGYLCARENPPEICPICKAEKERFEIFVNSK